MSYPEWLKERARQLAKDEDRSAEQIAYMFSKEVEQKRHDYRPEPRTIRNWLKMEKEMPAVQTSEQLSLARRHDERIFENLNNIWDEKEMLGFLSRLDHDHHHIINDTEFSKLCKYFSFFTYESNQYIQSKLRGLCEHLSDAIADLTNFISKEFYHFHETQAKLHPELRDPWDPPYKRPRNHWANDKKLYLEYEQQLKKLIDAVEKAYKAYRAEVRETLFL